MSVVPGPDACKSHRMLVAVALANKIARIAWALMRNKQVYREPASGGRVNRAGRNVGRPEKGKGGHRDGIGATRYMRLSFDSDPIPASPYGPAASETPQARGRMTTEPDRFAPNPSEETACILGGVHVRIYVCDNPKEGLSPTRPITPARAKPASSPPPREPTYLPQLKPGFSTTPSRGE